jgi:hypothetical protein
MKRLYLGHNRAELLISILDVKVAALIQNLFGRVTSASIRIQCHQLSRAMVHDAEAVGSRLRHISYSWTYSEAEKQWNKRVREPYRLTFDTNPPEHLERIYMMSVEKEIEKYIFNWGFLIESTDALCEY